MKNRGVGKWLPWLGATVLFGGICAMGQLTRGSGTEPWEMGLAGMAVGMGLCLMVVGLIERKRDWRQREKEEQLHRENREAAQAMAHRQRLETIGTLTASIAHEFNNLLTPIMGYSMMALEKLPAGEEELYDDLLEIYQTSQKAKDIISRLSDLSRKNSPATFRLVSPDEVIRQAMKVVQPMVPKDVELQMSLNCWDQRMMANEIQIQQLLLNLVVNSLQAMEGKKGVVAVETSFDEEHICIRVRDHGCGIPQEIRSKVFQPFFTTKLPGEGTGLGLAIAAQVVEDHGGTMTFSSQVGKGTEFWITLPRSRGENREP